MVRRIPIRAKVAGALALPLVGLVAAVAIGVSATDSVGRDVTRQTSLASASVGHAGLIGALQDERNLALLQMLGLEAALPLEVDDRDAARRATDTASTALRHSISGQRDQLRDDYAAALESLTALADLRARVDAAAATPGPANREAAHEVFTGYTTMVATLFASHDRFSLVVDDSTIRQGDDLVHYGSHATDAVAQLAERLIYLGTGPGGIDTTAEAAEIAELRRDVTRNNSAIEVRSTGEYAGATDVLDADPRVQALPDLARLATTTPGAVDRNAVLAATPLGPDGGYAEFRDGVVEVLDRAAADLTADADAQRRLYLGGAIALVVAAVLVAYLVSRSITRPLRDLSLHAHAMATYRLPAAVQDILDAPPGEDIDVPEVEPLRSRSRDEVGDVARAFDDVQDSALGLAVEQAALRRNVAESFVNLGRRNQNLLSRLLDVVGDLERDERDSGRLAKLYRLDHLATRIRRNAESLLVLSGATPPANWQAPAHVSDVVRAALGEVENYERVLVRTLDAVMVLGSASSDLSHLLAELIENGLRHSPPRELVEMSGAHTPEGYTLTVVDHGLGMSPDEIERANQRLAGTESVAVTPARYLGHYVTAVLAARHGIRVRLRGSVVVGIAAVVDLPATLVTERIDALPAGDPLPPAAMPPSVPASPPARGVPDLEVVEPEVVRRSSAAEVRT
ncbi:MAG TPA: nitrate- and nitrite sensing domain-containing protein, partial [Acidimicrobiales bacterium]|nr:nitrate- and nitrite sensing domain-containing protein [Acidimicrobiales bacterium]